MRDSNDSRWGVVTGQKLAGFFAGIAVFGVLVWQSEPGFVRFLDDANLLFHEAGHPFVGLFSQRLETYGGTMGQLVFPVALAVSFWRKREAISFAASVIWFFENWLNIARYMADARAQVLPLVGGGDHDWARIFGRWHVTAHDTQIAAFVRTTGWLGMGAACVWVVWLWWASREQPAPASEVELANRS
ncbi:MAG TPA: hypothetical protein VGO59_18100 [Verrucomicrobiae bacterium]|jgi:hypothetical protein